MSKTTNLRFYPFLALGLLLGLKSYSQQKPDQPVPPVQMGKSHYHLVNKIPPVQAIKALTKIDTAGSKGNQLLLPAGIARQDTSKHFTRPPYPNGKAQ